MDKKILLNVALLTVGGLLFGYTLVQVVARRISGRQTGVSILTSVGTLLIGFSLMESGRTSQLMGLAGAATMISGSLITASTVRRGAQRLPPSDRDRIEGPRGDRQTPDG